MTAAVVSLASLADTEEMDHGCGASAPYLELDEDGSIRAALLDAPPYLQVFYNLLKSSRDSNAATFAELKSSHATNAAAPAENSRVLADTICALNSLSTRVDEVEQNQQALTARLDVDLAAVHENISRNTASNRESLTQRLLEDPREIVVRGILLAV